MNQIETYPGFLLPPDARVEQRHLSETARAIRVSKPGARNREYAVFESKNNQWRATGEVLSAQEVTQRIAGTPSHR